MSTHVFSCFFPILYPCMFTKSKNEPVSFLFFWQVAVSEMMDKKTLERCHRDTNRIRDRKFDDAPGTGKTSWTV